jgi:hypothetical protein
MSPLIHLITVWLIAILFSLELKERRIVVLAGIISDIDGALILISQDLFLEYHHSFGHSLIFGIPFILVISLIFSSKLRTKLIVSGVSLFAFISHLLLDIFGTNWSVNPFYPILDLDLSISPTLSNEIIYWVLDPIFAIIIFVLMAFIIYKKERSPVEFISVKLDKIMTGFFIYPFRYRCKICHKRASYYCEICEQYFCARHVKKFFATKCMECELK